MVSGEPPLTQHRQDQGAGGGFRRQSRVHTPITIDKTPVEWVNSYKFLGLDITEDLTWSAHTDAVLKKAQCELPATLLEVNFPPSRTSTPGGVQGKPGGLSKTPATCPTDCSLCCPQGDVSAASDPALAD